MSESLSRLDTFRGMLDTLTDSPFTPMCAFVDFGSNTPPGTLWDAAAAVLDLGGGDCSTMPQCTASEARELAREYPYRAGEIYSGLRPGQFTALRLGRDLSTLTNGSAP